MATLESPMREPISLRLLADGRRFLSWLSSARVVLSLIMLFLMFFMVVIPLYQLLATTLVWGPTDIPQHPGAVEGELTLHGATRAVHGVRKDDAQSRVAEFRFDQRDFGIKPFSAMFGTLKIKPEVVVEVRIPRE